MHSCYYCRFPSLPCSLKYMQQSPSQTASVHHQTCALIQMMRWMTSKQDLQNVKDFYAACVHTTIIMLLIIQFLGRKYVQHDGDSDKECDFFLPGEKNVNYLMKLQFLSMGSVLKKL